MQAEPTKNGRLGITKLKVLIEPLGGLFGLKCIRCNQLFYASTIEAADNVFDKHRCVENGPNG